MLTNYHGVTHPSQPNYVSCQADHIIFSSLQYFSEQLLNQIAMISGSTDGADEDAESNIDRKNVIDLLEAKGITWKSYQEQYTGKLHEPVWWLSSTHNLHKRRWMQ